MPKNLDDEKVVSPQEEQFCQAYGDCESESYGDATRSAVRAGYSEKSAHSTAWRLLRRPRVKERLKELYSESDFPKERVMSNLAADRLAAIRKGDIASAIRADEIMARRLGLLSDRLVTCVEEPGRQQQLTEAERQEARKLAELRFKPDFGQAADTPPGVPPEAPGDSTYYSLRTLGQFQDEKFCGAGGKVDEFSPQLNDNRRVRQTHAVNG